MSKTLFLCRGLPGSGKSTLAQLIASMYESHKIHSTDSYFMRDGVYKFDRQKLGAYHKLNLLEAITSMEIDIEAVIIDNTNVTYKEAQPYVKGALQYGYFVNVVEPFSPWKYNCEECFKRNTHSVPLESIKGMYSRWQDWCDFGGGINGDMFDHFGHEHFGGDPKQMNKYWRYGSYCR